MSTTKKAFDFARDSVYKADPLDLVLIGGRGVLPDDQLGPLDTEKDESHVLWDPRLYDTMTEEMVRNVDAYGVIVPIVIAKLEDQAVVVDGRQRVRAARLANIRRRERGEPIIKVACTMRRADDTALMGAMVVANEVRHDDDPATKIYKLKRLMARGVALEDAAITFGVSAKIAEAWLRFDDTAIAEVKAAVTSGRIALSAGIELSRLKDPEKQALGLSSSLSTTPEGGRVTTRTARNAAKRLVDPNAAIAPGRGLVAKILAAAQEKQHPKNTGEKTLAWWQGVEDALMYVLDGKPDNTAGTQRIAELRDLVEKIQGASK